MLYEYEAVKDNKWIIEVKPVGYDYATGRAIYSWTHNYPHELYWEFTKDINYGDRAFDFIKFRRFCDRKLQGDVIFSVVDRSYSYNYYSNPSETWNSSYYQERWTFHQFNFELLCDWYLVKKTFCINDKLPPEKTKKPHHDWLTNPNIDCSDYDKMGDPRWELYKKLEKTD